jgi:ectoine hydroxylase-related dioxygenase (phytanoyl-CoA dioxygenase family)
MSSLSHEQTRFFRDQGYFKLTSIIDDEQTERLRRFVASEKEKEDRLRVAQGLGGGAVKMYGLYERNKALIRDLISNPKLIEPLQSLLGPNVVFVTNRHNHATANDAEGTMAEFRLHRDILQPTRGLVTAAVYLEDSSTDNGCTYIVPGSQYLPYVGVSQESGGGTWMDEHPEYEGLLGQALPVPMPKGGVLLFDGLAFHTVGQNTSGRTRMSLTLGFRSTDELDANPDDKRQVVVTGKHTYRGNDLLE